MENVCKKNQKQTVKTFVLFISVNLVNQHIFLSCIIYSTTLLNAREGVHSRTEFHKVKFILFKEYWIYTIKLSSHIYITKLKILHIFMIFLTFRLTLLKIGHLLPSTNLFNINLKYITMFISVAESLKINVNVYIFAEACQTAGPNNKWAGIFWGNPTGDVCLSFTIFVQAMYSTFKGQSVYYSTGRWFLKIFIFT